MSFALLESLFKREMVTLLIVSILLSWLPLWLSGRTCSKRPKWVGVQEHTGSVDELAQPHSQKVKKQVMHKRFIYASAWPQQQLDYYSEALISHQRQPGNHLEIASKSLRLPMGDGAEPLEIYECPAPRWHK